MSYSYLREKRFLYGTHGGYFTGVGAGSAQLRSKRESYNFDSRLGFGIDNNSDEDTSEEEWRKLFDSGILIEKAVELVRQSIRYPKPMYQYSPDSPSPRPYEVPYGTVLIPNPSPPKDKEGQLIRDMGSEIPFHLSKSVINTNEGPSARKLKTKDKGKTKFLSKSLQSLKEIDESPLDRPTIRSRIASQKSKEKSDSELKPSDRKENIKPYAKQANVLTDDADKSNSSSVDILNRTKSLTSRSKPTALSTVHNDAADTSSDDMFGIPRGDRSLPISSVLTSRERFKTRSERLKESRDKHSLNSTTFRSESVFSEKRDNKEKDSSARTHGDDDEQVRRPSFMTTLSQRPQSTYEYVRSDNSLEENGDLQKHSYLSSNLIDRYNTGRKSLPDTDNEDKNEIGSKTIEKTVTSKTSNSGSSQFKEYNPERVPLKERLRNSLYSTSNSTETEDSDGGHLVPRNTPLIKRSSALVSQDPSTTKSTEKDDSLKSRFLRRFGLGSEEKKEEKKDAKERRHRKKSDHSLGDRKEKEREEKGEGKTFKYDGVKPSTYDLYTTRGMRMSVDHRLESIDINMETIYKTGTSLAEILAKEEEKAGVDMSKYHAYSPSVKQKLKDSGDNMSGNSTKYDRQKPDSSTTDKRSYLVRDGNIDTSESSKMEMMDNDQMSPRSSKQLRKKEEEDKETSLRRSRRKGKEVKKISADNNQPSSPRKSRKSEDKEVKKTSDGNNRPISPWKSRKKGKDEEKETAGSDVRPKSPRKSRKNEKDEQKQTPRRDNKSVMSIRDRDRHYLKEPKSSEFQSEDLPSPKGTLRRIHDSYSYSTASESEGPCYKTEQTQKPSKLSHKTGHVYEEEIKPVLIKAESVPLDFKSPRGSIYEVEDEQITSMTLVDQQIDDDFFYVLLQREVSEESLNIIDAGEEEESTRINNVFDKMSRLSFDSYCPSSELSQSDRTSSELSLRDCDITFPRVFLNECTIVATKSVDDLNELTTDSTGSKDTSSESIFTKIEKANEELYSGVLKLAKSFELEESDETVQDSSDNSNDDSPKIRSTSNKTNKEEDMSTKSKNDDNVSTDMNVDDSCSQNQDKYIHEISTISINKSEMLNEATNNRDSIADIILDSLSNNEACTIKIQMISNNDEIQLHTETITNTHDVTTDRNFDHSRVCTETVEQPERLLSEKCQGIGDASSENIVEENREMKFRDTDENSSEPILPPDKKELESNLEASPFKLQRMKKKNPVTAEVNSFDKAVEETTEDVNNMIHKCNSIDEINNNIQRSHNDIHDIDQSSQPKSTENDEPRNKLEKQLSENILLNRKRLSFVEKRLSSLQGHEKDLKKVPNVISWDKARPKSMFEYSKKCIVNVVDINEIEINKQNNTNSEVSKCDESCVSSENGMPHEAEKVTSEDSKKIIENQTNSVVVKNKPHEIITLKKVGKPENTKLQKPNYKINISQNKFGKLNKPDKPEAVKESESSICSKDASKTTSEQPLPIINDAPHATDTLANQDEKHIANNLTKGGTSSNNFSIKKYEKHDNTSVVNKSESQENEEQEKQVDGIKSSGVADAKSLVGIQTSLNEIATEEATSSAVNVDDVGEKEPDRNKSKSPPSSKSLADIKSRISAIKARRQQLKTLEVNKLSLSGDNDTLIVTEIADI